MHYDVRENTEPEEPYGFICGEGLSTEINSHKFI